MPDAHVVKIMVVEDHPLFSKGLSALIASNPEYCVVGEAPNLVEAWGLAKNQKPDLAIVDIKLGQESGFELITQLKSHYPQMMILVLSMYEEQFYSERMLRLGARGYIMKTEAPQKVLDAIKTVMSGKVYLSDSERERILEAMTGENLKGVKDLSLSIRKLSTRELQIFSCIGKGWGTIEIANQYKLSTKTIDTHKEHIKLKLHCTSSQDLRELAIEWASHPGILL
jgi:DNA-binding NarL/FixJ family response regulator